MGCVNAKALEPAKHNSVSFINVDTLMDKRIPNYFIEEPLSGNFDKKIDNEENNLNENDDNVKK